MKERLERVIRVCEITGKVVVVATNLTTDKAMAIVREKAKGDEFGRYIRIVG